MLHPYPHGLSNRRGPARLRVATGLAAAAAGALLIAILAAAGPDPVLRDPAGDGVRVGVVEGQSVPGYLDSGRRELAGLLQATGVPAEIWALVSLTAYLPPDSLPALLDGTSVAQVFVRAQVGTARTQVVRIPVVRLPQDVLAGMLVAASARDRERADYAELSRELPGTDPADVRLRLAYTEAAGVATAEAAAYRDRCACVFAAVVRGAPVALAQLAGRAQVRVVDPAPEVRGPQRAEFRPLLPEQVVTVPVETRPPGVRAPSGGGIVAPETPSGLPSSLGGAVTSASSQDRSPGSGPSVPVSEERAAVASAPVPGRNSPVPAAGSRASSGALGR